ncbi:MAG: PHP domain-containing protein [bacterium]|nr:PHP domain-containing protein [bacterium]
MEYIDLHIHTTASDGSYTPRGIVEMALDAGLAAIAITDHDTTSGSTEALAAGEEFGLEVIPGIELSVNHGERSFHMLGYFIDPDDVSLNERLKEVRRFREERNPRIIAKLNELGMEITIEEALAKASGDTLGRPHIAAVLLEKDYVKNNQEAFDKYLAKGAAAYVERDRITSAEAIELITGAGGVAVLAHPGIYELSDEELDGVVSGLAEAGLQGIEVIYPEHTREIERKYHNIAERYGLAVTGGTDFHGKIKPDIKLGTGFGPTRIYYEYLDELKKLLPDLGSRR